MLEIVIAGLLLGALVTFVLPWAQTMVNQVVPASLQSNVIVPVLVTGLIIVGGLIGLKKLGAGKYLRAVS